MVLGVTQVNAEIRCRPLSVLELRQAITYITQFIDKNKTRQLFVSYGWNCNLGNEDLYQEIQVEGGDLADFLRDSEEKGIFVLGESDLYIKDPDSGFEFTLCHEADVHFSGELRDVNALRELWRSTGYEPYEVNYEKTK